MRIRYLLWFCAAVFLYVLTAASAATGQPPGVDFDQIEARRRLLRLDETQLKARIDYWFGALRDASEPNEVIVVRKRLLDDYDRIPEHFYQYTFAEVAARGSADLFKELTGDLKRLKEVNIALAMSQMKKVTVQAVLEKMVVHPNPAVRYYGWRGYRSIRDRVLVLAVAGFDKIMYASMQARAKQETSAPVVAAMYQMFRMPPVKPAGVQQDDFLRFHETAYTICKGVWESRCRQVLLSDAAMANASRKAIPTLVNFLTVFRTDQAKRAAILQMIVEMAYCSGRAYDRALVTVDEAAIKNSVDHEAVEIRNVNAELLRDCEKGLNELTDRKNSYITWPLTNPNEVMRGNKVRAGTIRWFEDLKPLGLKSPSEKYAPMLPGESAG